MKSVYALSRADRRGVKIGVSGDAGKRALMLSSKKAIAEIHYVAPPHPNAFGVEKTAHALASAKRLDGEWFDVSPEEAIEIIEQAMDSAPREPRVWPKDRSLLTVRLPPALKRRAEQAAARQDLTLSQVVRRLLTEYVDKGKQR